MSIKTTVAHISTVYVIFSIATVTGSSTMKSFRWRSEYKGVTSFYRNISTCRKRSLIECATSCVNMDACASFFYQSISGTCQLHSYDFPSNVRHHSFINSQGTVYFRHENSCRWKNYLSTDKQETYFSPKMADIIPRRDNASRICEKENGRLLVIRSEEQLQNVVTVLQNVVRTGSLPGFWVGARMNTTMDEFMWSDGTILPRNSSLWGPGSIQYDPVTAPSVQCVAIVSWFNYRLDDVNCQVNVEIYPLCECHGFM